MTMSKSLVSCLGVKVSQLKVMCGLSLDSTAREERAVSAVVSEPIPAGKFLSVYKQRCQRKQLAVEFMALDRNQEEHTANAALRNVLLNSKQEVVTYDHSRVIIWDRPEMLGSDYYNASYIDGYNGPKEYIASQGPSTKCVASFWHMVWQEGVTCIVMATGLFENAMQQCDKYWVENTHQHVQHGLIHIWHEWVTTLAQLKIRTFRIQKEGCAESRLVTQYEMIGFHNESPDPGLLLDVRRRVISTSATQPGPILVHCRCGGGRTAVFIAVDFCLHQLQSEDRVDVYSIVLHLRRFRKNMVRTLSQYKQIYKTVAMFLQCGLTVYPADTLPAAFQVHYALGSDSKNQKLEKEFQTLQSIVPTLSIGDCASGHRVENRSKSRDIMMLPPECARPYLTTADCCDSGTDFINAAYVDGYHAENMYLVTQWPLRKTIGDLWRLMLDFKITSVAFLNDPQKSSRTYPRFWPKNVGQDVCYGPINVRYIKCEKQANIMTRIFAIKKTTSSLTGSEVSRDEYIVKMFQILNSGQRNTDTNHLEHNSSYGTHHGHNHNPSSVKSGKVGQGYHRAVGIQPRALLTLMEQVTGWQKHCKTSKPICVISKDGSSRVGLYCAISMCCDQVKEEREVDVFNAVRLVRKNRPQLVPNIEEYHYIYYFMTEFISLYVSKPDVLISEPSHAVSHHSSSRHNTEAATVLPNTLHGGVYVVSKDTNSNKQTLHNKSGNYMYTGHERWPGFKKSSPNNNIFVCTSHARHEVNSVKPSKGPCSPGSAVPCSFDYESGSYETYTNSRDQRAHSQQTMSGCLSNIPQTTGNHNTVTCRLHIHRESNHSLNRITFANDGLACGQFLSRSKVQPSDAYQLTVNDSSIIKHLPQQQSDKLSDMSIHPPSSVYVSSTLSEPAPTALIPTPFHTPEKYSNGRVLNGLRTVTSASLSPGSICKSSSFHSCSSQLSIGNNYLGNGSVSKPSDRSDVHSLNVVSGVILHPGLVSGNVNKVTSQPEQVDGKKKCAVFTGLSSTSTCLPPDLSKLNANTTINDTSHVTLVHASYVSLDDSLADSADAQDHSSVDWLEHDEDTIHRYSHAGNAIRQTSYHAAANSNQQRQLKDRRVIQDKITENSAYVTKFQAPKLSFRQKIKGYMNKKRTKRMELEPSTAVKCSGHFESQL